MGATHHAAALYIKERQRIGSHQRFHGLQEIGIGLGIVHNPEAFQSLIRPDAHECIGVGLTAGPSRVRIHRHEHRRTGARHV